VAPPPPPASASVQVLIEPEGQASVTEVRSVTARLSVAGTGGDHGISAEFLTPSGTPYESRSASISGSAFDDHTLEFNLPVAGTLIDSSNLSGTWKVQFFLDGARLADQTFELTP
jgi:hypothetical protein